MGDEHTSKSKLTLLVLMQIEDKLIKLTPGMAVTVEVKTASRRVIEYFLSPLMQYKDESLRER